MMRETKNPAGDRCLTIRNQMKSGIYGEDKHIVNFQSDKLVISNGRSNMTMERIIDDVMKMVNREEGFAIEGLELMTEIMLIDKGGSMRRMALK